MKFIVKGEVVFGKNKLPFTKEVEAKSKNMAVHKVYSLFGSNNGLKRERVIIKEVSESGG